MTFSARWPDGSEEEFWSPSLVVWDHLRPGESYTVGDFSRRTTYALCLAGDRVREAYGFLCTSAAATTEQVQRSAARYHPDALVEVVAMSPPLPTTSAEPAAPAAPTGSGEPS